MTAPEIEASFAPLRPLRDMDRPSRRRLLHSLAEAGLPLLLTEGATIPGWLIEETAAAGVALGGGLAIFSDHAGGIRPVPDRLRPVTATGAIRPQMEWYRGIVPTDHGYERDVLRVVEQAVLDLPGDHFNLDFLRWPFHWEIELRDDHDVVDTSFDPATLRRFRKEMAVDVPIDDATAAAGVILGELQAEWIEFKCRVITDLTEKIASRARRVRPDLVLGHFVVPGTHDQRRRHAGQDVAALGEHVDVLLPMTYHAILHRPPRWVGDVVADLRRLTSTAVVPVVQATSDPRVAGPNDWGPPFPAADLGTAIDAGIAAGGHGFVIFPAHGLDEEHLQLLTPRTATGGAGDVAPR